MVSEKEDYDKSATPSAHAASHQDNAADEIYVEELRGVLEEEQKSKWSMIADRPSAFTPAAHKASHQGGGADEIDVGALSGLLADEQNAGKVKGVIIDDSAIADGKVLTYVSATGKVEYI